MTPLWFFRGIEEMKYVAYLSVITKILYTASIFLVIKEENDYALVALLSSFSHIIVGVIALYYIYKRFHITFYRPKIKEIKYLLHEGKDIFLSKVSVSLYSTTNNILLGFLAGYTAVGIYAIANTIYGAFLQLVYAYNTVVYPHLAKYLHDKEIFIHQARKLLGLYMVLLLISSLSLYLSSEFIIKLLFGENNAKTIEVLNLMALALIITPIGGYLTHFLALKSEYKIIRKITFYTMLINFIFVYPMIINYQEKGIVYLMIIVSLSQILFHIKYSQEIFNYKEGKKI
jgi:PST family polysaccharide transporter